MNDVNAFEERITKTAPCPCGGETYVDSFYWPRKETVWFLRCNKCGAMSKSVLSYDETVPLQIEVK